MSDVPQNREPVARNLRINASFEAESHPLRSYVRSPKRSEFSKMRLVVRINHAETNKQALFAEFVASLRSLLFSIYF